MERCEKLPQRVSSEHDAAAFRNYCVFERECTLWDGGLVSEAISGTRTDRANARIEAHFIHEEQH